MNFYDSRYSEGVDAQLIKNDTFWGESYFYEKSEDGKRIKKNYFMA